MVMSQLVLLGSSRKTAGGVSQLYPRYPSAGLPRQEEETGMQIRPHQSEVHQRQWLIAGRSATAAGRNKK